MDLDAQQGDLAACGEEDGAVRCPLWRQVQQEARVMVGWVSGRVFLRVFVSSVGEGIHAAESTEVFWPFVPLKSGFEGVHYAASGRGMSGLPVETLLCLAQPMKMYG